MPRVPLESTEHFTWPGSINSWPTQRITSPTPEMRKNALAIEESGENPPPIKVWDTKAGFVLVCDPENSALADAYRFLRYSYIPIHKQPIPAYNPEEIYPQEILDFVPMRHIPRVDPDDEMEDPF